MAGNTREKPGSFEAAELALKVAGKHLNKQTNILPFYSTSDDNAVLGMYNETRDHHPWSDHEN